MNILYLAHRVPYPPNKGDKLRAFRQIEFLSRNHRVWCACFIDAVGDQPYVNDLAQYCHVVQGIALRRPRALLKGMIGLSTGGTMTESFYRSRRMKNLIRTWCQEIDFDAVVSFSSSMAPYALSVATNVRVVDLCDLDSAKWKDYARRSRFPLKQMYNVEGRRLARREADFIRAFEHALLITQAEVKQLPSQELQRSVHVVGNGVSLPERAEVHSTHSSASGSKTDEAPTVGFIGTMDYRPNVEAVAWFAEQSWPGIRRAIRRATFRIIGRNPTRRVQQLAKIPGVVVVGEVPNVADELARLDVSVAPLQIARGLQNKVLEAMAAAKPVVLTTAAAEGIDAQPSRHFLIADTADQLTENILAMLKDEQRRRELGAAARDYVQAHHNWTRELQHFELLVTGSTSARSNLSHTGRRIISRQSRDLLPSTH